MRVRVGIGAGVGVGVGVGVGIGTRAGVGVRGRLLVGYWLTASPYPDPTLRRVRHAGPSAARRRAGRGAPICGRPPPPIGPSRRATNGSASSARAPRQRAGARSSRRPPRHGTGPRVTPPPRRAPPAQPPARAAARPRYPRSHRARAGTARIGTSGGRGPSPASASTPTPHIACE